MRYHNLDFLTNCWFTYSKNFFTLKSWKHLKDESNFDLKHIGLGSSFPEEFISTGGALRLPTTYENHIIQSHPFRDWVIGFLGYFWWFLRSYTAKTAIFKIWVFWVISMYSITLFVIDIHNIRCLEPFFYHFRTTLKFGGFWESTGSISWNLVIWQCQWCSGKKNSS